MLPKMDGFLVCRSLKLDRQFRHIPIIMLTARAHEIDRQLGKETGADAYITKPFEMQMLVENIHRLRRD